MQIQSKWFQRRRCGRMLVIVFLTLLVFAGCSSSKQEVLLDLNVVKTDFGTVRGYTDSTNGVRVWKGIPYAKPPVGNLRWMAPVDPDSWDGTRDAITACSACSQQVTDKFWRPAPGIFTGSEDCLYLDIYRPSGTAVNLPVFVWIHGGANIIGSAQLYDATALAKRGNMMVVVVQYRLGMFGWLSHPAFRATGTAQDQSGNFGTLDQMKALSWIQNNIAEFGGDPGKVTIGGQSAGGQHVLNLIISPLSNTFHRAFAMSPALNQLMPLSTFTTGDARTNGIIDWLLVDDGTVANAGAAATYRGTMSDSDIRAYLRGKTNIKIMQAAIAVGSGSMPVPTSFMDGVVMPTTSWLDTINSGNFKKVPLIIGSTKYEYKDLMTLYGVALKVLTPSGSYTWGNVYDVLNGTLTFDQVLPTATDQLYYEEAGLLKSRKWQFDVNQIARAIKANDAANTVYTYYFTWDGGGDPNLADFKKIFGASHAQDVPFVFGANQDLFNNYSFTAANQTGRVALQGAMMDYLSAFVQAGNPNPSGSSLLNWTQWSNTDGANKFIIFDAGLTALNLSMSPAEATKTIVNTEIGTAFITDPAPPGLTVLFAVLGILPLP